MLDSSSLQAHTVKLGLFYFYINTCMEQKITDRFEQCNELLTRIQNDLEDIKAICVKIIMEEEVDECV